LKLILRSLAVQAAVLLAIAALGVAGPPAPQPQTPQQQESAKSTLWVIPHSHWEGAVFQTREGYLKIGLPHILQALDLLRRFPDYHFVLDQVAYVKPFLERYPEEAAEFRKFVREGRLEIVGANDVMLDVNMPSGESWVRQALYGKRYYERELGTDVTVGWAIDTFGHHAQMPQLLKLAGFKSYWFQRGVPGNDTPSEFLWQGVDGTKIPAFWLALGYGLLYPVPSSQYEFDREARDIWRLEDHYSHFPNRVAVAGADVIDPQAGLPEMVHAFDRQGNKPFTLRFGVPTEIADLVAKRPNQPVISGELNPIFQSIYSNRIELKQHLRNDERILITAEKLAATNDVLHLPAASADLERAWEPVMFNEAHDLASGTIVDKVYKNCMDRYKFAKELGMEMIDADLTALASHVDTTSSQPGDIPVMVYNSLGWPRTDIAEANIGFSEPGFTAIRMLDTSRNEVPVQLLSEHRYGDGGLRNARIAFIARNVPAMGYAVYQVVPEKLAPPSGKVADVSSAQSARRISTTMHVDEGSIENEYYRATFDLWTGAMIKLVVKSKDGDWNALGNQPANVVAREQDGGDSWELYGTLNGARFTRMTRNIGLPIPGRFHLSAEWVGGSGATEKGPVFSEFHISHPFGSGNFVTTVRLYPGIRRIDITTRILNNDQYVRYRVLFPTSIKEGQRFDAIPFGSIHRPTESELPAQDWIDWADGRRGVALLNRGLPGNNVAQGTLLLSLMRSARISAYPFEGGYEPGSSSDLGLELGVERTFHYALVPHGQDWRKVEIYREGLEFNNPLIVRPAAQHSGTLPKEWGLLQISEPNVVLSALKPGPEGSIILRVYEATGRQTSGVKVKLPSGVFSVQATNLLEGPGKKLPVTNHTLGFDIGPYQIKNFRLQFQTPKVP
jgi:alpha-mannosidase